MARWDAGLEYEMRWFGMTGVVWPRRAGGLQRLLAPYLMRSSRPGYFGDTSDGPLLSWSRPWHPRVSHL